LVPSVEVSTGSPPLSVVHSSGSGPLETANEMVSPSAVDSPVK
jgi:hypothetical protein